MTFCSEFITLNNTLNIPIRIKIQCWKIDPPISLIPTFMRSKRIVYLPTSAVIANRYIRVPRDKRLDHLDEHFCTYNHNHTGLTLQTYSSWVRTSTHRQREEPSTCSKRRYFSATSAAWNWCCGGCGLGGAGEAAGEADSRSDSVGDCARSSALLCSTAGPGLLRRSPHNNEGDPGSITTQTLSQTLQSTKHTLNYDEELRWNWHDLQQKQPITN